MSFPFRILAASCLALTAFAAPPAALSPFGIGACNQTSQELPKWIPQMEKIGLRVMRTTRTHWSAVEPEEGKWAWDSLDEQMRYLGEHHIEFSRR